MDAQQSELMTKDANKNGNHDQDGFEKPEGTSNYLEGPRRDIRVLQHETKSSKRPSSSKGRVFEAVGTTQKQNPRTNEVGYDQNTYRRPVFEIHEAPAGSAV